MKLDTGLIVVIVAVLIFYLRLIILQQQRVKRLQHAQAVTGTKKGKKSPPPPPNYSIFSKNTRDRVIAGLGLLAIVVGVLMNRSIGFAGSIVSYWWIPVAAGIIAFSFGLK